MTDDIKVRVMITKGSLRLTEMHSCVNGGRTEFVFGQPIPLDSERSFTGFALECWLDQNPRHIQYREYDCKPDGSGFP